jgi:DNA-binding NtrC family response regulator
MSSAEGKTKILVADDSADLCRLITVILEAQGYAVETVTSGESARQRLLQSPGEFAAIISDIAMPGENGLALLKLTRDRCASSKFILMSGLPQELEDEGRADGFLLKPFTRCDLLQIMDRIFSERKAS